LIKNKSKPGQSGRASQKKGYPAMKKIMLLVLLVVCTAFPLSSALPHHSVTRDCAIFIQIDRIPALIAEIERYAISFGLGLSPGDLSKKISGGIFGQDGFPGIDLNKPLAVFLLHDGQKMSGGVVMVPVSDQNLFASFVLSKIPLGNAKLQYRDGYALIASEAGVMDRFVRGQKKPVTLVPGAQVSFYMDMALFKDEIRKLVAMYDTRAGGTEGKLISSVLRLYSDVLQEMQGVTYALSLESRGLELGYAIDLKAGGKMARVLAATPTGSPDVLGRMPADSYLAIGSRMNLQASLPLVEPVLSTFNGIQPELGTILKDFFRDAARLYGDDYAMALVPSKTSGFTMVGAVKQAGASTQTLYHKLVQRLNGLRFVQRLKGEDARFGLVHERSAGTVAGVSYDTIRLDFTDPEDDREETRKQVALVREIFVCHVARKNGVEYWAMGTDAKNRLAAMLDGSAAGFRSSEAWRTMTAAWGAYSKNGLMYFSLPGLLKEATALAKRLDGAGSRIAAIERFLAGVQPDGGIFMMTKYANNSMTVRGLVTRGEIQAVAQFVLFAMGMEKSAIE